MQENETTAAKIVSAGAPLFRKPGTSHKEFTEAWHRHGQLVMPWCLHARVQEYIQIHMPCPSPPSSSSASSTAKASGKANDDVEGIKSILRQADGFAIMRRREERANQDERQEEGGGGSGEGKKAKRYFETVVLVDERRFLHDECGAGAVRGDAPVYDVPQVLDVDVWREAALGLGGVEYGESMI
jgi:hypothetical protein